MSQASPRPGCTTAECPYNPAHGISLHRLPYLRFIQRWVQEHPRGHHFTKYSQAYPTKNQTTRTTAYMLFNKNFSFTMVSLHACIVIRVETLRAKLLKSSVGLTKVVPHIPYHPMGNGQCECFNRTLLEMLGTLEPKQKSDWRSYVSPLVHVYNCIKHETTCLSPYLLLFGWEPRLAITSSCQTAILTQFQP